MRIELDHIAKHYGDAVGLQDITLEINGAEFMVFVGPSGCGKSTLLRVIAGFERPSAGEVRFDGVRMNDIPPERRGVAMVFQSYALYPHMSVEENIAFGLRNLGRPKPEVQKRVQEVAAALQIQPVLARRPSDLSGGQRQRVAIARAIARNPRVFLFDEPLSNLDASLRGQMRVELAQLHRQLNVSTVFVTHDQVEAMTLADRIAVLNRGRLEQVGAPLSLYHAPANRFVAGFFGSPPMNFAAGEIRAVTAGYSVVTTKAGGRLSSTATVEGLSLGHPVTIGVRPEHLELRGDSEGLLGRVELVEHLGARALVHVRLTGDVSGTEATWIVERPAATGPGNDPDEVRLGERVVLGAPPEAVHLFDAKEQALSRRR